ncbi:hypothetical protein AYI92_02550 [Shewanella xiamenensis]|nr:hypothetical protein AYI90_11465 [Shewanella xiamenensis]TVL23499.1 hypothetical protein AYI91_03715 [Shewanella xiamenensis]TVL28819.1 hypothetical protein AYI92_02550 [Shewanella xiamenensis]TVL31952.1 hypothetical protein AYI93_12320 [Shewanella xiamenensis]TVP01268.1 hypothetical protein AYI89_11880 [Shewanella xiamenensis]
MVYISTANKIHAINTFNLKLIAITLFKTDPNKKFSLKIDIVKMMLRYIAIQSSLFHMQHRTLLLQANLN